MNEGNNSKYRKIVIRKTSNQERNGRKETEMKLEMEREMKRNEKDKKGKKLEQARRWQKPRIDSCRSRTYSKVWSDRADIDRSLTITTSISLSLHLSTATTSTTTLYCISRELVNMMDTPFTLLS